MNFGYKTYSNRYTKLFEEMKRKILHLSTHKLEIEHIGSTAVEGLGGKGVIDISIGIRKWKDADETLNILKKIGFKHFHDIENNSLFVSSKTHCKEGDYHIHISIIGTKRYEKTLAFRDFLMKHSRKAQKYAITKKEIFERCGENRQLYKKLKNKYFSDFSRFPLSRE
jgi:GrpB-like predicted nucleotidyltransferase (UPF0157 family)